MKRRLLSALLALSMFFSLIPTTFAQQSYDSDGNLTGSPKIIKDLKVEIEAGKLTKFDFTFDGSDGSVNATDTYYAAIFTNHNFDVDNEQNDAESVFYEDAANLDYSGAGTIQTPSNLTDEDTGVEGTTDLNIWSGPMNPAARWTGATGTGQSVSLSWNTATHKTYDWSVTDTGFDSAAYGILASEAAATKYTDVTSVSQLDGVGVRVIIMTGFSGGTLGKAFVADVGALDAEGNLTFPASSGEDTAITAINATITAPAYGNTPAANATDISVAPAAGCKATSAALSWDGDPYSFAYDTDYTASFTLTPESGYKFTSSTDVNISGATNTSVTVDADTGVATVNATFHSPAQQTQTVGAITATVNAPALNTAPANALSAISGTGVDTSSVTNLAWSPNDLINGKFKAGQAYTVSFDVSPQSGYKFASGTTTATVNGNNATVNVTSETSATVSYTFAAIDKKVTSISSATGTLKSYKPNDTFKIPNDIDVVLTYNDGSTAGFSSANFASSGFSFVYGTGTSKNDLTIGQALALSDNNQPVFVKYTGSDIDGGATSLTSASIGNLSVTYDPINSVAVTIDEPAGGKTAPTNAAVVGTVNYSVDSADVTWYEGTGTTGNQVSSTDKLQYGSTYTVSIVVSANENYKFADTLTSATINSDNVSPTVAADTVTLTKTFTIGTAPAVTLQTTNGFDKYNNGNNVVLKTDANLTGVNASVIVNGTTKTGTYNPTDGTITFAAADLLALGANLTSTGETWTASVLYDGITTAKTVNFTAKDTTPYITITDPSDGTITGITHTSGTKVALTKNQAYTLTAAPNSAAHWTGTTWTVSGISGAESGTNNDTYKFTPTGSEDITVSVAFTKAASYTLTVNATNGSVAVKKDGNALTANGDGTYTIYSDETYTLTATANNQYKFVNWTGNLDASTTATNTSITIANPTANKTVTANFAAKTAPTVSADMVYRKGANDTDKAFTITLGDYSGVNVNGTPAGTLNGTTYTVSASDLENATVGEHTYTFNFGEGKTLTGKIEVKAAMAVSDLTLPSGLKHGDTLNTISFKVTDDGNTTTYTYSNGSWGANTPGNEIKFQVGTTGTLLSADNFVSTYLDKAVYVDKGSRTGVLQNGDSISVSAGSSTSSATLSVAKKDIVLEASTTDTNGFNKTYDGTATVTASPINWAPASGYAWVDGDIVSAGDITITGKYQKTGQFGTDDENAENLKQIKFTATATSGTVADKNYNITVNNGSGKISPKSLTITSVPGIPSAPSGVAKSDTVTKTITNDNLDSSTPLASADSAGISIKYTYTYDASTSTSVNISAITSQNSNYTITPTSLDNQTGSRNARIVKTITVAPTTTTYNYSDTLSAVTITVAYDDTYGDSVYNSIADAVAAGVSVYWGSDTTKKVTDGQALNVSDHSKDLTAAFGGKTGSAAITVNPLQVIVTVNGTMTKEYDGDTTYDAADNAGGSITYSAAIDTNMTGYTASYGTQFTTDGVTATGATVAFNDKDVPDANAAVVSNGTINNTSGNYKVTSTANNVTSASITAKTVNVTAITNVPKIYQGEATLTGTGATATNKSGATITDVVGDETVQITYTWTYSQSTNVADPDNNVTISDVALDTVANNDDNKNYILGTVPNTGTGAVQARTVNSITVIDLSDMEYTYGEKLALSGLQVQISYNTGDETYVWNNDGTWTKQVAGQTNVSVTNVPFDLTWNTNSGTPTNDFDITVAYNNDKIKATSTVDPDKSGTSGSITVNPIKLSNISITGDNKSKVYDGTATLTSPGFTYALTDSTILSTDASTLAVAPSTVEYSSADVHTSQDLKISGWGLTNSVNGNYELDSANLVITGTPKGTITQRPITLNSIEYVPAVDQYSAAVATDGTAASNATGTNTKANIAASTGGDDGLVSGETVTVSFNYQYDDTSTAGTNNITVTVNGTPTISDTNYKLEFATDWPATGTVNSVAASDVRITAPTQFGNNDLQYGDKLDYDGLEVEVDYGATATHTDTFTYDGTGWKKGADTVTEDNLPFTWAWSDNGTHTQNESLAVTTSPLTITATLRDDTNKTATTASSLKVGKRKVTVTPKLKSGVTKLTKVYNSDTDYTNNGDIEFNVTSAYTGTLPTVTGATYTYNDKTVSGATKVTVTDPELSDTTNFVVDGYTNTDLAATITARPIKLTAITNVPNVKQYDPDYAIDKSGNATNKSGATFETGVDNEGIVGTEEVRLKYSYKYSGNNGTGITASVTNIDFDGTTAANNNYSLTATDKTVSVSVDAREVTLTVTNPSMFNSTVTYGDKLSLGGMQVVVNYDGTPTDTYAATQSGDTVSWTKNGTTYTGILPFTLAWTNGKGDIATDTQNTKLTVSGHSTQSIVATHTASGVTGSGATVTISPKAITVVNAALTASTAIEKVYDGNTNVETADLSNIEYTSTDVSTGDTVVITATPSYTYKDVANNANNPITFGTPSLTNDFNGNYKMTATSVTSSITGTITQKAVTITGVYIPSTYTQDTQPANDEEHAITNATISSNTTAANTVTATGFLDAEKQYMQFDYTIVYAKENLTSANTNAVTIKSGSTAERSTNATYPVSNYNITWSPSPLNGNVLADKITGLTIEGTPADSSYTHGDALDLSGLAIKVTTQNDTTGTTYTVISENGSYKWNNAIPSGVSISIGSVSLLSDDALNGKAHYTNMGSSNPIVVSATDVTPAKTGNITVAQKQLTASASTTDTLEKVYDKSTALPKNTTIGYTITAGEVAKFGDVTDKVSVTASAAYVDANVNTTAGDDYKKSIVFTNINLTGADAGNYIAPSSINSTLDGKITPFTLTVTAINDTLTAKYKDESTKTGNVDSTTNYTTSATNIPDSNLAIKYDYEFDNVNSINSSHTVTIKNLALADAHSAIAGNYEVVKNVTKTGTVEAKTITGITITNQPKTDYKYGDTLNLSSDLEVTVTYSDNSTLANIKYGTDDWNALGLKIDNASLKHGDDLKTADAGKKIKVTTRDGSQSAETNELTVNPRTLYITATPDATVTKTYDGTNAVDQTITITLAIADGGKYDGTDYDGLLDTDTCTLSNTTPSYTYNDKNVGTGIPLTMGGTVTLQGTNAGEYKLTFQSLTGAITAKDVTLTPSVGETIYANKFATDGYDVLSSTTNNSVTANGFATGEADKYTLTYTLKLTADELKSAGTVSVPVLKDGSANTSYTNSVAANDATNYPLTNYNFQWQDASVTIAANNATGISVKTDPTAIANQKYYGDSLALDGMVVTVTYTNGTRDFTYSTDSNSDWVKEGFAVAIEDGGSLDKLVTGNNGKHIVVTKTGVGSANTTSTLKVAKKQLHLTAEKADSLTAIKKTYDTNNNAMSLLKFGYTDGDKVTGDTISVVSTNATATFDNANKGTNKDITIAGLTITATNGSSEDVADQYERVMPTGVTGEIEALAITVTPDTIPPVSTASTGDDLKVNIDPIYSTPILTADVGTVYVTLKGTYDATEALTAGTGKTVNLVMTENGNSAGNYTFTLASNTVTTGTVQDNIITGVTIDVGPKLATYTHGDSIELNGMKITATYKDSSTNSFTYSKTTSKWTAANQVEISGVQKTEITTAELGTLGISIYLSKDNADTQLTSDTQQLRHDTNNGNYVVVKGDSATPAVTTDTLTVNTKEIKKIRPGYAPPTTAAPSKTYDGTTKVPDNSFVYYSDDILDADKDAVQSLLGATAEYAQKDASYEADGTTLKDIPINFSNPTFTHTDDSTIDDNYTLADDATMTSSNVKGTISKATITIKITSVPSITIGGEKAKTLTKDTHYTQNGEVTVNNVKETVDVAVTGTYEQNTTATSDGGSGKVTYTWSIEDATNKNNYTVLLKDADGNVIDKTTVFGPEGTVSKKAVTGISITPPTDVSYEHGDNLALAGMTITVSYGTQDNPDDKVYTYIKDVGWTLGNDTTTPVTPEDVTITWKGTTTAVADGAKLRLDNTDYATDGDNKKATISVAPSATGTSVPAATTDITIAKKQLTMTLSGAITKVYDGNNQVGNNVVLNSTTPETGKAIASLDGVDSGDVVTIQSAAITYDGKDVTTGTPALVVGAIAITGAASGYYKAPGATNITNSATGTITARPVMIVAITKDMDTVVGANKTGTLTGLTSRNDYTLKTNDTNYSTILPGEDIKINVSYEYGDTSSEHDSTNKTTVTYTNPTVPTTDNAYASNYNVSFNIAQGSAVISSGTVRNVVLSGPFQTGNYTHGDKFSLDNMVITVTYDNGNSDKYEYVDTTNKWTLTRTINSVAQTPVTGQSLPGTLSLSLGSTPINTNPTSDNDKTIVKYGNDTNTLVATYSKDSTTTDDDVSSNQSYPYGVKQKTITININPPTSDPYIEQEYQGQNNKSLNATNLGKLSVYIPSDYAVPGETVSVTQGTLTAEFASYDVARETDSTVKAQAITVPDSVFGLDGEHKDNYKIAVNNTATGKVTPKAATITANSVPAINEGATDLEVTITDYTKSGFVEGDTPTITWKGTYNTSDPDATSITVDLTTKRTVDDATANNYDVTFTPNSKDGTVTPSDVTGIAIKAPDNLTDYEHGDSIDLTGTEITVTYGIRTDKYVYDPASKKWTYTKGGVVQTDKVDLPSTITLSFTGGSAITPDSAVKLSDDDKTITATYKKDENSTPITGSTTETIEVEPKTLKITVSVKDGETIEQTYANDNVLNDDNFAKLNVVTTGVVAVGDEQITLTPAEGGVKAEFANATVARDENGNVIPQNIALADGAYTLGGNDASNYILVIESDATGTVKPATVNVTAKSVPSINEGATDLVVDITDYTTEGILDADKANITIEWQGTYDMTTAVVDTTTKRNVTGSAKDNYKFEFTPDTFNGEVKAKTVTSVTIDNPPAFATSETAPKHGDKIGEGGLDNLEYTVEYSDGSKTHHKIENGEWVEDDTYTKPEEGTAIKWNGSTEDATEDSVIRRDKDNTIVITVEGKSDTTDVVAADVKPITIKATGLYKKVYDGTNAVTLNETAPEITYVIEGLADGDAVTVKATPAFADENVAKFGDVYQKAISFTNVELVGDEDILANYTIAVDDDGKAVADIMGQITPKPINITSITVASKTKGSSVDVTAKKNKAFTTNDIIEKDKGTVTISYTGKYSSTSATGTNVPVTIDTIEIDGDEKAVMNYVIGTVEGAAGNVTTGGGGGGGGGAVNTLTIKYELEDGTAGDDVSKLEAAVGSDSVDLIGVFKTKPANSNVLWTSSDETVAKVDENGVVSFIGEGKATITATSESNKTLKDTVEVTVTAPTATPEPTPTPTPTHKPTGTTEPTPIPGKVNESIITKNMLNPYIVGYDDNVFGPELPISREEVSAIFARLIANNIYMDKDYDTSFPDVPEGWSKSYIGYLEGFNVVTGYEDGTFHPQDYITRAEMAVMMAKAEGYDISGYMSSDEIEFPDVDEGYSTWAIKAIKYLTDAGIMEGYTDGTFRPNRPITRAETVATVNRVLANMVVDKIEVLPSDVTSEHWAYNDIVFAMNHRILKDVAADPNAFIWSEQFDENMQTITEVVEGEGTVDKTEPEPETEPTPEPDATTAE